MNPFIKSVIEKVLVALAVAAVLAIPFKQGIQYVAEKLSGQGRVPVGTVLGWNGEGKLPDGWAICDGRNGTPDLRDRFLIGTTPDKAGQNLGVSSHKHEFSASSGAITNPDTVYGIGSAGWKKEPEHGQLPDKSHIHSVSGDTKEVSNLPPSYSVVFIIRL